nr:hypothetical protein [Tanacetum cinerariifolium]
IYQQFVADPALGRLAPAVRNALDPNILNKWGLDGNARLADYPYLTDQAGNPVAVAGVAVRVRPDEGILRNSDFTIRPDRVPVPGWPLPSPLPLVLRPGLQALGKFYYNNSLLGDSGNKVPASDPRALPDRTLPGPDLAYPYLTLNDLLEETLLTVPYEVDGSRFVTGQLKTAPGYKPTCWPLVKPLYFDYFTAAELATQLTMELDPACVRVRLRIPVAGGFTVDYERAYYPNPRTEGLGRLLVTNAGLSVFPFVKIADAPQLNDFYKALVVPRWREVRQGTKEFRFAIDFGTTNTHVAYHDGPSQPPQPFNFGPEDTAVALLKKSSEETDYQAYEQLYRGIEEDPAHGIQLRRW